MLEGEMAQEVDRADRIMYITDEEYRLPQVRVGFRGYGDWIYVEVTQAIKDRPNVPSQFAMLKRQHQDRNVKSSGSSSM
jgi:hypothetical protein